MSRLCFVSARCRACQFSHNPKDPDLDHSFSPVAMKHTPALANISAPRKRRSPFRRGFALWGPAFAVAVSYVDPGNYATNIQAGSQFGYALLWVVLWSNLIGVLVQLLSSKLGLAASASLATLLRDHLPRWAVWLYWAQAEVLAIFTDLAEFIGASLGFQLLFGI